MKPPFELLLVHKMTLFHLKSMINGMILILKYLISHFLIVLREYVQILVTTLTENKF